MSKHTQGPWLFKRDEYGDRTIKADGKSIMCDTAYYPWCPDEDADWHLIAAAPELLEALKAIKERIDTCHLHVLSGHEVFDSFHTDLIANAIAKAEGTA